MVFGPFVCVPKIKDRDRYRITDVHPYLSREDEYPGLTLEEAASRMDDLTGVGADVILSDWDENCPTCRGFGYAEALGGPNVDKVVRRVACWECHGTGKRSDPWEWVDDETGREVTMRREVG